MKKHRLLVASVSLSLAIGGLGTAYVTHNILESEYSRKEAEYTNKIQTLEDKVTESNKLVDGMYKSIDEIKQELDNSKQQIEQKNKELLEKDELIKSISANFDAHFNPEDVSEVSGVTRIAMRKMLEGKPMASFSDAFVDAEREYGINALFLAGIVAQESGWGTSDYAIRYNNVSGTYINGKIHNFPSKYDSVMYTAKNLSENYIDPKGEFHKGKSVYDVNTSYCLNEDGSPSYSWTGAVTRISRGLSMTER